MPAAMELKPVMLCKFFNVNDHTLNNLENSTVWFSLLKDFNDPFEGNIKVKMKYEENLFSNRAEAEEIARTNTQYLSIYNKELHAHIVNLPTLEEKIGFIFDFWADTLKEVNIENISEDGYCCFSDCDEDILSNQLMWSHYSDGLRGFCLVFDKTKLQESLIEMNSEESLLLEPIKYRNDLPEINIYHHMRAHFGDGDYFDELAGEFYLKGRSTKSMAWSYERECRAISSKTELHKYSPNAVRQIILGAKMPDSQKEQIKSIGRSVLKDATIHTISLEPDQYQLSITE